MTLSQMREKLTRALQLDLDHEAGEDPTTGELTDSINSAIRTISLEIYQIHPLISFTLTQDETEHNLRDLAVVSRKVVEPLLVRIGSNMLRAASGGKYGMWTLSELNRIRPSWPSDSAGTPTAAIFHDRTLYLHPKPDATAAALTCYIQGQYLAADMVDGEDDDNEPDIPEELHEDIVRIAAVFAADPTISEGEALARVTRYEKRALERMAVVKRRNRRTAQDWGTTGGYSTPDYIRL